MITFRQRLGLPWSQPFLKSRGLSSPCMVRPSRGKQSSVRFEDKINSEEVREYFETLGLDVWDAWSFFKLLDRAPRLSRCAEAWQNVRTAVVRSGPQLRSPDGKP